jgi:hypothetical protein
MSKQEQNSSFVFEHEHYIDLIVTAVLTIV